MNQSETNDQYLEINSLTKYFGDDRAVDGISFNIPEGKFLTLLVFAYFCLFLVARSYKLVQVGQSNEEFFLFVGRDIFIV